MDRLHAVTNIFQAKSPDLIDEVIAALQHDQLRDIRRNIALLAISVAVVAVGLLHHLVRSNNGSGIHDGWAQLLSMPRMDSLDTCLLAASCIALCWCVRIELRRERRNRMLARLLRAKA